MNSVSYKERKVLYIYFSPLLKIKEVHSLYPSGTVPLKFTYLEAGIIIFSWIVKFCFRQHNLRLQRLNSFKTKETWSNTLSLRTYLFFSKESQYRASSSGDLLDDWAIFVTALLFINRPQAYKSQKTVKFWETKHWIEIRAHHMPLHVLTLSSAATKPASLLNADMTKALYFLWTSSTVCTYIFGSCNKERLAFCNLLTFCILLPPQQSSSLA